MKKTLFLTLFLIASMNLVHGQSFQIKQYGLKEGLCHESTYNLIQDVNGYIWVSTTQGLCRLDGRNFTDQFLGDTLPNIIVGSSFRDSKDRIWFGYLNGQIAVLEGAVFKTFPLEEYDISSIVGFQEDRSGNIYAMSQQNGLFLFNEALEVDTIAAPFQGAYASSFKLTADNHLLVGGFDGLTLYASTGGPQSMESRGKIEGLPFTQVQDIIAGKSGEDFFIGTSDEGLYHLSGSGMDPANYTARKLGEGTPIEWSSVSSLLMDRLGYLWVSDYGVGVYRFRIQSDNTLGPHVLFNVDGGMPEEYIKDIQKDDEGNIWFASQSNGVAVLRDQAFTFYDLFDGIDIPEITSMYMRGKNYWFGTSDGFLFKADETGTESAIILDKRNGIPEEAVTAIWQDEQYNVYVGTESSGVYMLPNGNRRVRRYFQANNSLGNSVNAIDGNSSELYIATNNGIYIKDRKTGNVYQKSTSTGLPHNVINDVLVDYNGRAWIATRSSGIYCVTEGYENLQFSIQGSPKLEFVSMVQDKAGAIWAATSEDGVFRFDQDTLTVYSTNEGLMSKYTYAVEIDPDGYVWVGHRLGLSKVNPETGNVVVFDAEMGFTSDISARAIDLTDNGMLLFGTNNGIIAYDTEQARPDTVPPRLNISALTISDQLYDASKPIKLPFGNYKIRFDFVGINLSNPDQVTYRYKLDGFDDWSDPTRETYAKYSRIEDGNYRFMMQACDGNGNCTGEVDMVDISVKIPIWKAWWFILTLFAVAVFAVFLIIKIRERNQKALQEYLERQLDERTREVVHQKEEIEIKNRDITDSINYAQRIQASILPPIQRLENTFSGSFVFYQPRDIVSGDFYWYDLIDEDRFIIVCADSTGHGVPGAFMSMIGTTLIKDICLREGVDTPSDVLKTLDTEVREALNQNKETDGSNDGMDIIVAEMNLKTNKFMVSSAMRPVILYKDGEQIYVKGSRSSVGGQLDESGPDKEFSNEEFQLTKGDIVYMFSDGYPDQFGGPLGRKFKMVRLKNLLRDIHDKPMEEQHNYIKSNFFLWKEDLEQVDDVLFMGLKI